MLSGSYFRSILTLIAYTSCWWIIFWMTLCHLSSLFSPGLTLFFFGRDLFSTLSSYKKLAFLTKSHTLCLRILPPILVYQWVNIVWWLCIFFSWSSGRLTVISSFSQNLVRYDHFKDAQKIVKEVKSSFSNNPEKSAELRRLEQVAEHNSIALNIISRAGALDPSLKVSFEFNHHPYFATAVVKRSWIHLSMILPILKRSLPPQKFRGRVL